ncbi:MAG: DNA (cytosine-5-)-methyltransferase [Candidatus Omnitrophota bacterium]|nr:DNA (cytosine-5-)-methyltransferase [Candidatus Omnitrophota bacterium]
MYGNRREIRYIELFAGAGGFRLGIERAFKEGGKHGKPDMLSAKCVFANEWDKYCCQIYNKNFGTQIIPADIRTIEARDIPAFDLLCGGFPCQAFSIAGKRRGFNDSRGTLFFEIARILEVKRPRFIFLENVKGLLNHDKGETFRVILQAISELGYEIQWMVLNSKFFGVPQNRERVFIIGSLGGEPRPEILPFGEGGTKANKGKHEKSFGALTANICHQGWQTPTVEIKCKQYDPNRNSNRSQQYRIYESDGLSPTLPSSQAADIKINHTGIRRLTPIECERLQGFPDNWTQGASDTQRYKMMGNAVTVNVIEAIVRKWFGLGKDAE